MQSPANRTPSPIDRHIGARLRALRKAHGMSQAELAARLGVDEAQVARYERGTARAGATQLFAAAHAFDVPATPFFAGLL
jgi:transcriptional regulator with XRE-family HTH domain